MLNTINKSTLQTFNIPGRINSLQAARFFSAAFVSLFHFSVIWKKLDPTIFNVGFWIRLFFCISGFVVMLSTQNPQKKRHFFTRRLIRLAPLYWILTIGTFLFAQFLPEIIGYRPTVSQLLKSMFFIPFTRSALKSDSVLRPLVGLGHTLQVEVMFALIFTLCIHINHKLRGILASAVLVVFIVIGFAFDFTSPFLKFYIDGNMLSWGSFILGILCYHLLSYLAEKHISIKQAPSLAIPAALIILSVFVPQIFYSHLNLATIYTLQYIGFFFVIIFVVMYSFWNLPTSQFFIKLGTASFSYYLIHYFLVSVSERVFKINSFSALNILMIVITLAISWVCALVSWYLIENLLGKYLNSKLK